MFTVRFSFLLIVFLLTAACSSVSFGQGKETLKIVQINAGDQYLSNATDGTSIYRWNASNQQVEFTYEGLSSAPIRIFYAEERQEIIALDQTTLCVWKYGEVKPSSTYPLPTEIAEDFKMYFERDGNFSYFEKRMVLHNDRLLIAIQGALVDCQFRDGKFKILHQFEGFINQLHYGEKSKFLLVEENLLPKKIHYLNLEENTLRFLKEGNSLMAAVNTTGDYCILDYMEKKGVIYGENREKKKDLILSNLMSYDQALFVGPLLIFPFADSSVQLHNCENNYTFYANLIFGGGDLSFKNGYFLNLDQDQKAVALASFDQFYSQRKDFTTKGISTATSALLQQITTTEARIEGVKTSLPFRASALHKISAGNYAIGFTNGAFGFLKNGTLTILDSLSNSVSSLYADDSLLYVGSIGRIVLKNYLASKANVSFRAHTGFVTCLAQSPNKQYLLSASSDGQLKLWSIKNKSLVHSAFTNKAPSRSSLTNDLTIDVLFSDGTSYQEGNELLYKKLTSTDLEVISKLGHARAIRYMDLSKNGAYLLSVDDGGVIKVWQTQQMIPIHTLQIEDGIDRVQFIEEGSTFFAFSGRTIYVVDTQTGLILRKKEIPSMYENFMILDVEAANNGRFFFITCVNSNGIYFYNLTANSFGWFADGPTSFSVKELAAIPNNPSQIVALGNEKLTFFSTNDGKVQRTITHPNNSNNNAYVNYELFFSPNGKILLAYQNDSLALYDVESGKKMRSVRGTTAFFTSDTSLYVHGYFPDKRTHYYLINPLTGKLYYEHILDPLDYLTAPFAVDQRRGIAYLSKNAEIQTLNLISGNFFERSNSYNSKKVLATFDKRNPNEILVTQNSRTKVIDRVTGTTIRTLSTKGNEFLLNADYSKFATYTYSKVKVYDANSEELLYTLDNGGEISFIGSSQLLVFDFIKGLKMYDANAGALLWSYDLDKTKNQLIQSYIYSPSDNEIVAFVIKTSNQSAQMDYQKRMAYIKENTFMVGFDAKTGKEKYRKPFASEYTSMIISSKEQVALQTDFRKIKLMKGADVKEITFDLYLSEMYFSEDGELFFVTGGEGQVECFSTSTGQRVFAKQYHSMEIKSISCSDSVILTAGMDGKMILMNKVNGSLIGTYLIYDSDDYVLVDRENNYMGTPQGVKSIYFKKGDNYYPIEQFDAVKNRPDLVLKSFGERNEDVLAAYTLAVQKRWKKMGYTSNADHSEIIPTVQLTNKNAIPQITDKSQFTFLVQGSSKTAVLNSLQVWLNDVPIYGVAGISNEVKGKSACTITCNIELVEGANKIQFAFSNSNGLLSEKETVYMNYEPKVKTKQTLYLITLGASQYVDSVHNLYYAAKDAVDITTLFLGSERKAFDSIVSINLTNKQLTRQAVLNLRSKLVLAKRNDAVLIAFSGHGLLDNAYNYYLATSEIDFEKPERNGLKYEELEGLLDGILPLKKLLLIDACHSGEVEKDEVAQSTKSAGTGQGNKGGESEYIGDQQQLNASELSKQLFNDLRRGTGATIISASGGLEFAQESSKWNNGLFTYCLLKGLGELKADTNNDEMISLSELQKYVQQEVQTLSGGLQKPTSRIENLEMDWRVW